MTKIPINYDNLDIAALMAGIKESAAQKASFQAKAEEPLQEPEPLRLPGNIPDPEPFDMPYPDFPFDHLAANSRLKKVLMKLMRPFTPLIKLMILPVNEDVVRTVQLLDYTNRRLDYFVAKSEHHHRTAGRHFDDANMRIDHFVGLSENQLRNTELRFESIQQDFRHEKDAILHNLQEHARYIEEIGRDRDQIGRDVGQIGRDLQNFVRHAAAFEEQTSRHLDELEGYVKSDLHNQVSSAAEYVKLLHNLAHNTVVELTKLKIEHETLKNKIRVKEKDFETLARRERALEKKVFE